MLFTFIVTLKSRKDKILADILPRNRPVRQASISKDDSKLTLGLSTEHLEMVKATKKCAPTVKQQSLLNKVFVHENPTELEIAMLNNFDIKDTVKL